MTDNASAGATPVAGGATPPQSSPAQPAASPAPSTTGDPEGLGEAGTRALAAERLRAKTAEDRAKAAERERDELRTATQSEAEKAVAQAKKDGAAEATTRYHAAIRRSEVRSALLSAGVNQSLIDLASRADQFATLKVSDEGEVEGIAAAVEAFRKATPDAFAKAAPRPSDSGLGPRGTPSSGGTDLNTWIRRQAGRA